MHIGRIVGTAALGFLFLLFVALDLVLFGVIALNSALITLFPIVGIVAGGVLGAVAGRRTDAASQQSATS